MSDGNREYKSDVFSMLLEDKRNVLDIYNALNGSSITNTDEVEICNLEGGILISARNNESFVVDATLSIYEYQSTICPRKPVISVLYYTMINECDIYGRNLLPVPLPRFVAFYNGEESQPERYEINLSRAFEKKVENPQCEIKCTVYNINYGRNSKLMSQCKVLRDYLAFVDYVRMYHKKQEFENLEMAINLAIDRCIRDGVLIDFFDNNRENVVNAMEWNYALERRYLLAATEARIEGFEEGRLEVRTLGRAEGRAEAYAEIEVELAQKDAEIERLKGLLAAK